MSFVKTKILICVLLTAVAGAAVARGFDGVATRGAFVENKGQITGPGYEPRADIQFRLAATGGLNVFIGSGAIHYQFGRPLGDIKLTDGKPAPGQSLRCAMYRMDVELVGARADAAVVEEQLQPGYENYYTPGTGANGALAGVCNKITYKEVYPHIDWVLYVKDGGLKHEFVVRQGGRVSDIQLRYGGATVLRLAAGGSLSAATPMGVITEQAPYSYDASGRVVQSRYHLAGNILSFQTGSYTGDLTIDPSLEWATYYGGGINDLTSALTTARNGDIYMAGYTSSTDNIATTGAFQDTVTGSLDIFLARFTPAGARIWGTYFGGTQEDVAYGVAADTFGHVYVCGYTSSSSAISTPGVQQPVYAGVFSDALLVEFDTAGHRRWATYLGGGSYGYDQASALAVDHAGHVYMAGVTSNTTLIASAGAFQATNAGGPFNGDAFLVKYDTTGHRVWGTYYGGSNDDFGKAVCVDRYGAVYIAGQTSSGGLSTPGAFQTTSGGGTNDAYIAKFDSAGARIWGTYYGGNDQDYFAGAATDTAGNLFVAGRTGGFGSIASTGAYQTVFGGLSDVMLVKFDSSGARQWGTYYGGTSSEFANAIAVTDSGDVFIAGGANSATAIATADGYHTSYAGSTDAFLAKFSSGGARLYGTYYGASGIDNCAALAVNGINVYFGGLTENAFGIATAGSFQPAFGGLPYDGYLVKFTDCPDLFLTSTLTPGAICDSTTFTYTPIPNIPTATLAWTRAFVTGITTVPASGTGAISEVLVNSTPSPIPVTYVYTISSGACADTQSIHVVVDPRPLLSSATTATACTGVPFHYTPISAVAGTAFAWTRPFVTGIGAVPGSGTGGISETLVNTTPSPVTVVYAYTLTANGCSYTQPLTVTVNPTTAPAILAGPDSVCVSATITLTASIGGGSWSSATGNATVAAGVVTGVTAGSDVISYTITGPCGPATATHPITVKPAAACSTGAGNIQSPTPQLTVYPNPSDGAFRIQLSSPARQQVLITITDIMGRKIYEQSTETNKATDIALTTAPGVYILSATAGGATYITRMVVSAR